MEKRDVIRRTLAGAAMATLVSLPFVGAAYAQTDTDTDTDTDGGGGAVTTTTAQQTNTTARPTTTLGGTGLARTGNDWAIPLTVAGAGVAVALGARRLSQPAS